MVPSSRLIPALLAVVLAAPSSSPAPAPAPPAPPQKALPSEASTPAAGWTSLEPGLDLGLFEGPKPAPADARIWVVRIDPSRYQLRLVNASAGDERPRTVRQWAVGEGAAAAINAGMFQTDGLTSVGLMRTRGHQNNPRRSKLYNSVLAFDPVEAGAAPVQLLDATCGEVDSMARRYGTLIQSIRMVSCDRRNVWAAGVKRWSTAAIGVDSAGRVLFIHARFPWPVHDVVDALLALPIQLLRAMYVEGGPEAQLFVRGGGRDIERLGALEGSSQENGGGLAWEIPNAVVAVRRNGG